LSPITALGQPFDPNLHQAVAVDRESGQAKGMIVAEVKKGFYLKGRLFRAAEVVVAE